MDDSSNGLATDTLLLDTGYQEDDVKASNTTIFSGGAQLDNSIGSAISTTVEANGAQVAAGTVSRIIVDAGGPLVMLPGAIVTDTTVVTGASSVSSGIAIVGGTLPFYAECFASSLRVMLESYYV